MENKCEVCNRNESIGVASSSCGPISHRYCLDCLRMDAEPYGSLVGYLSCAVNKGEDCKEEAGKINSYYQGVINVSLAIVGKTREEFYADIDALNKQMEEELNEMREEWVEPDIGEEEF